MKSWEIVYETLSGRARTVTSEGYLEYTAVYRFKKDYAGKYIRIISVNLIG